MTRKDYVLIAETLRRRREELVPYAENTYDHAEVARHWIGKLEGVDSASRCLADALVADNPRFDRERFLVACGVAK